MRRAARSGRCHKTMKMYRLVAATVRAVCFGELEMMPLDFLVLLAVGELGEAECRGVVEWCRARNSQSVSNALARLRRKGLLEVKGQKPCVMYEASAEGRRVIEGRFARLRLRMQDDEEVKR
jgi:hypothetical protein